MPDTPQWCKWNGSVLELRVLAQTLCRNEGLAEATEDALRVRVNAPPVEGKANKRLVVVLAEAFGVAKSRVRLVRGGRSRRKWFRIEQPATMPEQLKCALGALPRVDQTRNPV